MLLRVTLRVRRCFCASLALRDGTCKACDCSCTSARTHTHTHTHTKHKDTHNKHTLSHSHTEAFECTEMLLETTWTAQADLFAVASTIHCLLHNEYMAVELSSNTAGVTTAAPKLPLKRYWKVRDESCTQTHTLGKLVAVETLVPSTHTCALVSAHSRAPQVELWKDFFDTLMNSYGPGRGAADVVAVRVKLEQFLAQNESKCAAVRVCLMKQDLLLDQFFDAA